MLGIGAAFGVSAAQADTRLGQAAGASDARNNAATEGVLIRLNGGRIQISDRGKAFEDLPALDTPAGMHLHRLLEQRQRGGGAAVLRVNPTVVADRAGGGGWGLPQAEATVIPQSHPKAQTASVGDRPKAQVATRQPSDKKAK